MSDGSGLYFFFYLLLGPGRKCSCGVQDSVHSTETVEERREGLPDIHFLQSCAQHALHSASSRPKFLSLVSSAWLTSSLQPLLPSPFIWPLSTQPGWWPQGHPHPLPSVLSSPCPSVLYTRTSALVPPRTSLHFSFCQLGGPALALAPSHVLSLSPGLSLADPLPLWPETGN